MNQEETGGGASYSLHQIQQMAALTDITEDIVDIIGLLCES